ncbi:hypothetical protein LOTGIDRAFT_238618 [Lottia gigantea]|uniref:Cadherin domain-containing protein n=1 Tax=Lottia gigantea TaxID=225164 RepID=V4B1S9_LOTGI|nr:hypothetical protein LOTGIDRAFT_238618 [Lottia gigantea]ESP00282.1 hypothetical protein LOTGIDRAFT_238618 [Lottia gigantea]
MGCKLLCLLVTIAASSGVVLSVDQDLCLPRNANGGTEIFRNGLREDSEVGYVVTYVDLPGTEEQLDLRQDQNEYFQFNTSSRNVVIKKSLDFEKLTSQLVDFQIFCKDRISNSRETEITVKAIIEDVNDNKPKFDKDVYYLNVSEDTNIDGFITTYIKAEDLDAGNNGRVLYSIQSGPYSDYFDIEDKVNSVLKLKKKLDFETNREMSITILAKDAPIDEPVLSSTAELVITVLDADDQPPVFRERKYTGSVNQNSPQGTSVTITQKIEAYDPDISFNSSVRYYLIDPDNIFTINADTSEVTVLQPPTSGKYTAIIEAIQVDNELMKGTALLEIVVLGTDKNPPVFERENYYLSVPESTPVATTILTVSADDQDFGDTITYSGITVQTVFLVDSKHGDITVNEPLDFENQREFNIVITATDGTFTATTTVQIKVTDVNDNNPIVTEKQITVEAARKPGTILTKLEAYDKDENSKLKYELLSHTDLFTVSDEGVVSITGLQDELKDSRYDLVIEISDNGETPRKVSTVVTVVFDPLPVSGAVVMANQDDTLAIVFGVLAAVMLIIIILLVLYIVRRRQQSNENLNQSKLNRASMDPKGLKFQSKQSTNRGPSKVHMSHAGNIDETSDGATTIQENPFNDDHININYGYVHSDSETDREMDEIQIEAAVIPYDAYNHNGEVYTDVGGPDVHVYQTMSTFKDNSSNESINSESTNSKKALVGGGANKRPAMQSMPWDSNGQIPSSMQSFDPDTAVTPVDEKPEITVYF